MKADTPHTRTEMVLGEEGLARVQRSHVMIVGLGGVGSYAAEAVARAGVRTMTVVDFDTVDITNLNRQLCALHSTIGQYKVDIIKTRIRDIAPETQVRALKLYYNEKTRSEVFSHRPDFILDCIDSVSAKLDLILTAQSMEIPIISALGTGKKLYPTRLFVGVIYKTSGDALARVMRHELRKHGVLALTVVSSDEPAAGECVGRTPGSVSWVPGCAGLIMAGEAITRLAGR